MSSSNDFANQNNQLHPSNDPESERQPVSRPTKQLKSLRNRIAALVGRASTDRFVGSGAPIAGKPRNAHMLGAACVGLAAIFALVPSAASAQDECPNAEFRTGKSVKLPDCRAYELVSLPESGGQSPIGVNFNGGFFDAWDMDMVRDDGASVMFQSVNGAFPGLPGTGYNDRYLSTRTADGWEVAAAGPDASLSEQPGPGGITSNHAFSLFQTPAQSTLTDHGSLVTAYTDADQGEPGSRNVGTVTYIRKPDGSYELVGQGSLGEAPVVQTYFVTPDAEHIIFQTGPMGAFQPDPQPLEPGAPEGETAIYDRSLDGPTHLVSVLPDETPLTSKAMFIGASEDGELVAFTSHVGNDFGPLYVRVRNQQTREVTDGPWTFGGIFGGQVFYADEAGTHPQTPGDLFSFDAESGDTTQITNTSDARFTSISPDGSRVYFTSPSQIGGEGTAGQPNLYLWERDGGSTSYIATLTAQDVTGDTSTYPFGNQLNVSSWTEAMRVSDTPFDNVAGRGSALNRTNPDGSVMVFEAQAQLTSAPTGGHTQVYRYDAEADDLRCLSCGDSGAPSGRAQLQSLALDGFIRAQPLDAAQPTDNVTPDGETVVFESDSALVSADRNGARDVYRWTEGQGLALISTGEVKAASYLWGMSTDASTIVISTPQDLVPEATNGSVRALYAARVDGGFEGEADELPACVGDECQADPTAPPAADTPASVNEQRGNPQVDMSRCNKLERKADRAKTKARKLNRKARSASKKSQRKTLRKKARSQNRKAKRIGARARTCRRASK